MSPQITEGQFGNGYCSDGIADLVGSSKSRNWDLKHFRRRLKKKLPIPFQRAEVASINIKRSTYRACSGLNFFECFGSLLRQNAWSLGLQYSGLLSRNRRYRLTEEGDVIN